MCNVPVNNESVYGYTYTINFTYIFKRLKPKTVNIVFLCYNTFFLNFLVLYYQ